MRETLLELLVDPVSSAPLALATGSLEEGVLRAEGGAEYPIRGGIPRFVLDGTPEQGQTGESFDFKWGRRQSFDSPTMVRVLGEWLVTKYGFADEDSMRGYFAGKRVLDAGCGAGLSASTWLDESIGLYVGADISSAVDVAAARLGGHAQFVQADLLRLPFAAGSFDAIFSEGVLHHTPSTESGLRALVPLLRPGGELLFYVYRRKSPVREFTDDHVRELVSPLDPDEAWEALRPLTRLAQALAELEATVDVPEDVPLLGIPAGRHDVQRLIYWHFAKLFWNAELTFEENNHVNFDWYHPRYAHRQTEEEVRAWCADADLEVTQLHVEEAGLTVRAVRR